MRSELTGPWAVDEGSSRRARSLSVRGEGFIVLGPDWEDQSVKTKVVRIALFVVGAAVLLFSSLFVGAGASARSAGSDAGSCVGLECAQSGDADFVPEAEGNVRDAAGDRPWQSSSGFYEYESVDPTAPDGATGIGYFIREGDLESAPESVKSLPIVQDMGPSFQGQDLVVIDSGAVLFRGSGSTASRGAHRRLDDFGNCPASSFCLYKDEGFSGGGVALGTEPYEGAGWIDFNLFFDQTLNNNLESMRNHRRGIGRLARDTNGDGIRYCAQVSSEDASFGNNPIDNNLASSVKMQNDNYC